MALCAVHAQLHHVPTAGRMPCLTPALELARPSKRGRAVGKAEGDAAAVFKGMGLCATTQHHRAEQDPPVWVVLMPQAAATVAPLAI